MRSTGFWLVVSLAVAGCARAREEPADYTSRILALRAAKDAEFRNASEPIPKDRKAELLPLEYFAINPVYQVPAILKPSADTAIVSMPTSSGESRPERRAGTLEFTLDGQALTLTAFVDAGERDVSHLFVPFSDLTSGTETYRAGRYLDVDRTQTGRYDLDFNRAYHPYCYYNFGYECPLPPIENRLNVGVPAGERLKTAGRPAQSER